MNRPFAAALALFTVAFVVAPVRAQEPAPAPSPADTPPAEPKPEDPLPPPEPTPAPEPAPETTAAPETAPDAEKKPEQTPYVPKDEIERPGYVPGYRSYPSLSLSPYTPRVGAPVGGVTPSFGSKGPMDDWLFSWSGFMSASLQVSLDEREDPQPGQKKLVFHAPPIILEEYASFVSTNSLPGNWIGANFNYGNSFATATVQIATWNPTRPTNGLALGSQYFINDMYVKFRVPPIAEFRSNVTVGFFSLNYGGLGRYGGGFYTNAMVGGPVGAGYMANIEHDLTDTVVLQFEQGIMGPRIGTVPMEVVGGTAGSGTNDPQWTWAFTNHVHLGVLKKGDLQIQGMVHYMTSWAQDDRIQREASRGEIPEDNRQTPEIDESYVRDPRIRVYGAEVRFFSKPYGVLGVGGSYTDGYHAFPLKGIVTFGGDGERLTSSWWGPDTSGTGTLLVGGIAYDLSLSSLLLHPEPFSGNGPDVQITAGMNIARTTSADPVFDGRVRHKWGIGALYTFLPYVGAGVRFDRVVPSSLDPKQTFHVLAPRLQFKTDWQSHEAIVLSYVKWFMGPESHLDGTQPRTSERIDDQMFTLNFNMWW